jgi:hypothetical protein
MSEKNYKIAFFLTIIAVLTLNSASALDPRFHTYGQMVDEMIYISVNYPNITRLHTIGYSTGFNLPILAMKISDNPQFQEDEPRILYNGVHHACEIIGVDICLTMLWDLVTKYNTDSFITNVINNSEIWIVPIVNPDGHYITRSSIDTLWRKNCRDNNLNGYWDSGDGVDLNRNYDFQWVLGGSPDPSHREYRGPYPFSENESRAIRDLAQREKFVFDICYHSHRDWPNGEAVYYPWRWVNSLAPDYNHIKTIAESIALRIPSEIGSNYTYSPVFGRATEGGLTRNWLYHAIGTFAYTIEVSRYYYPDPNLIDSLCARNMRGAYYLLERVFQHQITGHVTDSISGQPLVAEVRVLEAYSTPDTIQSRMTDSIYGRFYRILSPGDYTVQVIKSGYLTKTYYNVPVIANQITYLPVRLEQNSVILENDDLSILTPSLLQIHTLANHIHTINFNLEKLTDVKVKIYSRTGELVKTLIDQRLQPGDHSYQWAHIDNAGMPLAKGIYFVQMQFDHIKQTKKIILVD